MCTHTQIYTNTQIYTHFLHQPTQPPNHPHIRSSGTDQTKSSHLDKNSWQFPLKILHPQNPPNPETQIPQYKSKWARGKRKQPRAIGVGPLALQILVSPIFPSFLNFFWNRTSHRIEIGQPKSQFEFVPWDTEESEILDMVDFGVVSFFCGNCTYAPIPTHKNTCKGLTGR